MKNKLMKKISTLLIALTLVLTLSSCASWYKPMVTESGEPVYSFETFEKNEDGSLKLNENGKPISTTEYTTLDKHPETGEPLEVVRSDQLKDGFGVFGTIGSLIMSVFPATAPFAPLIPEALALVGTTGLVLRGRRKINLEKAKGKDMSDLTRIFMEGYEKLKTYGEDIRAEDLKQVLIEGAVQFKVPELLDQLVDIAISVLPKTEKAKLMDAKLEEYLKKGK